MVERILGLCGMNRGLRWLRRWAMIHSAFLTRAYPARFARAPFVSKGAFLLQPVPNGEGYLGILGDRSRRAGQSPAFASLRERDVDLAT